MKLFDSVQVKNPTKNKFNLSHERKMAFEMGDIVPMLVQEILPGDEFRVKTEVFLRLQSMLAPIMHKVNVKTEYFFVPNRLVWDEWEPFITGGREGISAPVHPYIQISQDHISAGLYDDGSLADFMGITSISTDTVATSFARLSALPFRAYQLIWDEYYRDQNLHESLNISKTSGAVSLAEGEKLLFMRKRAWEKDYFTSALPWAQRGPSVGVPIEGDVNLAYKNQSTALRSNGMFPGTTADTRASSVDGGFQVTDGSGTYVAGRLENIQSATVDNVETTINDLRRASKLQEWLELIARTGARYVEQLKAFFNVKSSDARQQRPEYITGGNIPVKISEVLSTYQDPEDTGLPQGNMAGHGYSAGSPNSFKRFFEEHGYLVAVISVMPKTSYQNGIPRGYQRFDKLDYAWPQFANLGEQEIRNSELFYDPLGTDEQNADTFGYIPRYAEYKYIPSTVHGSLRNELDFWHMGRKFTELPPLNWPFVQSDPTKRIFAVQTEGEEHLIAVIHHRIDAKRPLPYFGTPSLS